MIGGLGIVVRLGLLGRINPTDYTLVHGVFAASWDDRPNSDDGTEYCDMET